MKTAGFLTGGALLVAAAGATAADLEGPARYCGYSAIIDLAPGEAVTAQSGGMHGGWFEWSGSFGTLQVRNNGFAKRPEGTRFRELTTTGQTRFHPTRKDGKYRIALWNRRYGTAYFQSDERFTESQLAAIDRVHLYDEWSKPEGCSFRTARVTG
jgi:hypothetical protein